MRRKMTEDIQRILGRIESKVDTLVDQRKFHDKRITSLEHSRTRLLAYASIGAAVLSFGASTAAAYIGKFF